MKTGVANLPLHYGKAPSWLFQRMKLLAREIVQILVYEQGRRKVLENFADPYWFQAFGCVLGFDWHSSGLTTTVCGAVKEALKDIQGEIGLFMGGGKGGTSRKTPQEIAQIGEKFAFPSKSKDLIYASRMSAKVDNTALQDSYNLYHHVILFTQKGDWAVVQQGMNTSTRWARRYHWLSEPGLDFVNEPHKAICCDHRTSPLNMVAEESTPARETTTQLINDSPEKLIIEARKIKELSLPARHHITRFDFKVDNLKRTIIKAHEQNPQNFEQLLGIAGVGPKTIRALALISELVYDTPPSYEDPVKYSFAHGGKDGYPFPVDRKTYDSSINTLKEAVNDAKIGRSEKLQALRRLSSYSGK